MANKRKKKRNVKRYTPSEYQKAFATYIAMVIRNATENFHSKYLSDSQMKELNPIIHNAVVTALYAIDTYDDETLRSSFLSMGTLA
jgi:hypothetical protein